MTARKKYSVIAIHRTHITRSNLFFYIDIDVVKNFSVYEQNLLALMGIRFGTIG